MKFVRYIFFTHNADNPHPLVDMKDIQMPWWCTGYTYDKDGNEWAKIVCYLPDGEPLKRYWDDADYIMSEPKNEIKYTDRFPKPEWISVG